MSHEFMQSRRPLKSAKHRPKSLKIQMMVQKKPDLVKPPQTALLPYHDNDEGECFAPFDLKPVSYTHLTLPTIYSV